VTHIAYIKRSCAETRSGQSETKILSSRCYWRSVQQISFCWFELGTIPLF